MGGKRRISVVEVTRPALVLGSTQPWPAGPAAPPGLDVVRRASGGGAVLVVPAALVWVDIVVPPGDPLWEEDVGRAFHWLGGAWAESLQRLGVDADWHDAALVASEWSPLVCFAGLGPGEVTVDRRKVVGMSQRRTRQGSLFQCAALLAWDAAAIVGLVVDPDDRARAERELRTAAAGVAVPADDLVTAFVDTLGDV